MTLITYIYKTIYTLVHTLYTHLEFFRSSWVFLNKKLLNVRHEYLKTDDYKYVSEGVKVLNKKPNHISMLLGKEEPSYADLAKFVLWCIAAGITYVSFFDHKGVLQKSERKLQEAIEKQNLQDSHVIWVNKENSYKNGFSGKTVYLRTLSVSDGKVSIANSAKQLCADGCEKIDQEVIDKRLKSSFVFPDPDLGVYCGKFFSLYGYPPWQISVTEFISIGSHYDMVPETFLNVLRKYSKIEQRLGK